MKSTRSGASPDQTIRIIAQLEAHARWDQLRALGSSGLVRASVLMPAFGYMLLLNDNVHQYLTIKYDGWLLNYLPNVWRIWLLFYGSFILAAAAILYSVFCPTEIKQYASAYEMADQETAHQFNLGQFKIVRNNLKKLVESRTEWEGLILPLKLDFVSDQSAFNDPEKILSSFLIHQWNVRNIQRPWLRILILILFSFGLGLLAIPAILTFIQVSLIALKQIAL